MSHTVCIYTVMIWSCRFVWQLTYRFQIAKTEIIRDKYLSISYSRETWMSTRETWSVNVMSCLFQFHTLGDPERNHTAGTKMKVHEMSH